MTAAASRVEQLLGAAFKKADARTANDAISRTRDAFSELSGVDAWSYEVVLPKLNPDGYLVDTLLPRFTYFLHSHGAALGAGVFLSIFAGETLHFVAAADALALFCEWTGMSLADMKTRWGDQLPSAQPALLPAKTS